MNTQAVLEDWPADPRSVAEQIIEKYGEPQGVTDSIFVWYNQNPWVKIVVTKKATPHQFPMPHTDIVEQFVNYNVPIDKISQLVAFDGSISVKRTEGLLSARCHDEPANLLALNLAHDIIQGKHSADSAKQAYVQSMKDFRQGNKVPYMESMQFDPPEFAGEKGEQLITKEELQSQKSF